MKVRTPPLYERVRQKLRDEIENSSYSPGKLLPGVPDLSQRYGVSEITLRRALQDLAREGLVKRIAGVGTVVCERPPPRVALLLLGFEEVARWQPRSKLFGDLMAGISEVAWETWSSLTVIRLRDVEEVRTFLQGAAQQRSIDALLLKPNEDLDDELLDLLDSHGLPYVVIKRTSGNRPMNCVTGDDYTEALQLTEHLIGQGYRRIGFIGPPSESVFRLRFGGYATALRRAEIGVDEQIVQQASDYDIELGAVWARNLLASGPVDAVFCGMGSLVSRKVLATLNEAGLAVPHDLGFVMHDPDESGERLVPPVTSAGCSNGELGRHAAELLNRLIREPSTPPTQIVMPPHMVIRASTPTRLPS